MTTTTIPASRCSLRTTDFVPWSQRIKQLFSDLQSARMTLEEKNTIALIVCDGKGLRETGMVSVMLGSHTVRKTLFDVILVLFVGR
jgi:hypothetical protein